MRARKVSCRSIPTTVGAYSLYIRILVSRLEDGLNDRPKAKTYVSNMRNKFRCGFDSFRTCPYAQRENKGGQDSRIPGNTSAPYLTFSYVPHNEKATKSKMPRNTGQISWQLRVQGILVWIALQISTGSFGVVFVGGSFS